MHEPMLQYIIGVELPGDISRNIEAFFSVCKAFKYEVSGILEYVDRRNLRWTLRDAIEKAPTRERGTVTFRLKLCLPSSIAFSSFPSDTASAPPSTDSAICSKRPASCDL